MRLAIVFVALVVLVSGAWAGDNPDVSAFISFQQNWRLQHTHPLPGSTVHAYVTFSGIDGGVTGVTFRLTDVMAEYPGVFSSCEFRLLDVADISIGDPYTGVWVALDGCEFPPYGDALSVAELRLEYVGGEACIQLLDHPEYPRWVCDCNDPGQFDYYYVEAHGTVGGENMWCPPGDFGIEVRCEPQTPPNPTHPPTYWYECQAGEPSTFLRIRVHDPNPTNYTNWLAPSGWVCGIEESGDETWAVWDDPEEDDPLLPGDAFRFQFDNPSPSVWGDWEFSGMTSGDIVLRPDGYGRRVHVPAAPTPAEGESWGMIKALYR